MRNISFISTHLQAYRPAAALLSGGRNTSTACSGGGSQHANNGGNNYINQKGTMKTYLLAVTLSAIAAGALAGEAPAPVHQVSGTATVVTDYVFRGLTQTWHGPAVQGSIDYAHTSGIFASLWASNVSEKVVAGSNAEIDLVLGYKGAIGERWSYGAGVISVFYPGGNWNKMKWGDRPDQRYDFTEANAFVGYQGFSVKYSHALTDLLGFNEKTGFSRGTKGSGYIEINADIPLGDTGLTLGLHAGRQDFRANAGGMNPDFNDYRLSLSKAFADKWVGTVQVTENTNKAFFNGSRSNLNEGDLRDIGKRRVALTLTRMF